MREVRVLMMVGLRGVLVLGRSSVPEYFVGESVPTVYVYGQSGIVPEVRTAASLISLWNRSDSQHLASSCRFLTLPGGRLEDGAEADGLLVA